jgi:hypothetical protein
MRIEDLFYLANQNKEVPSGYAIGAAFTTSASALETVYSHVNKFIDDIRVSGLFQLLTEAKDGKGKLMEGLTVGSPEHQAMQSVHQSWTEARNLIPVLAFWQEVLAGHLVDKGLLTKEDYDLVMNKKTEEGQ